MHEIRLNRCSLDVQRGWLQLLRKAEISARFEFAAGVTATFNDDVEVSLDCCICHRCHRTVKFHVEGVEGTCTPTRHAFPGKLLGKTSGPSFVLYRLEYWYEPFTDAKRSDHDTPTGYPRWARVGFELVCPNCGRYQACSTQTNLVRPWVYKCGCGHTLYTETDEMPTVSQAD